MELEQVMKMKEAAEQELVAAEDSLVRAQDNVAHKRKIVDAFDTVLLAMKFGVRSVGAPNVQIPYSEEFHKFAASYPLGAEFTIADFKSFLEAKYPGAHINDQSCRNPIRNLVQMNQLEVVKHGLGRNLSVYALNLHYKSPADSVTENTLAFEDPKGAAPG